MKIHITYKNKVLIRPVKLCVAYYERHQQLMGIWDTLMFTERRNHRMDTRYCMKFINFKVREKAKVLRMNVENYLVKFSSKQSRKLV